MKNLTTTQKIEAIRKYKLKNGHSNEYLSCLSGVGNAVISRILIGTYQMSTLDQKVDALYFAIENQESSNNLEADERYDVGDVLCCDVYDVNCYIAHPETHKPYKPKIIFFMDLHSSFIFAYQTATSDYTINMFERLYTNMRIENHIPKYLAFCNKSILKRWGIHADPYQRIKSLNLKIVVCEKNKTLERFFKTYHENVDAKLNPYNTQDFDVYELVCFENYNNLLYEFVERFNNKSQFALLGHSPASYYAINRVKRPFSKKAKVAVA